MINKILYRISAERADLNNRFLSPFYYQQLKAYEFCLKFCKNKNVLEIGSGAGHGSFFLSKVARKVIAIDKDSLAISSSKKNFRRENLEFINTSIEKFETSEMFDCILSLQVIEHLSHKSLMIFFEKIKNLINDDGFLILSTPYSKNSSYNENPYHFKEYTFAELENILSKFFSDIKNYSVVGDSEVKLFEIEKKRKAISILGKDYLKIRNLFPRRVKQIMFDLLSHRNRSLLMEKYGKITTKNYKIVEGENTKAIDMVFVCKV